MSDKKTAGVASRRVYSYVAEDGTVFYSFTKMRQTVSTGKRLVLQSRNGIPLLPFMVFMREQAIQLDNEAKEASVEDIGDSRLGKNRTDERTDT